MAYVWGDQVVKQATIERAGDQLRLRKQKGGMVSLSQAANDGSLGLLDHEGSMVDRVRAEAA